MRRHKRGRAFRVDTLEPSPIKLDRIEGSNALFSPDILIEKVYNFFGMRSKMRKNKGFVLIVVIWALGLIGLLTQTYMTAARLRLNVSGNLSAAARAEALAEAGVAIGALEILRALADPQGGRVSFDGQPWICAMPDGGGVAISIESEAGKIDLNAASEALLAQLALGVGIAKDQAAGLAKAITSFRSARVGGAMVEEKSYLDAGRPFGPRKSLLQSSLELDQVVGVSQEIFRRLSPFVTVHAFRSEIDRSASTPQLLAILDGGQSLIRENATVPATRLNSGAPLTIHSEALSGDGAYFVREALVNLRPQTGRASFIVKEWKRALSRNREALKALFNGRKNYGAPHC